MNHRASDSSSAAMGTGLPCPGEVACTPGIALHVAFNSNLTANKRKGGSTIRRDDLFSKPKLWVYYECKT